MKKVTILVGGRGPVPALLRGVALAALCTACAGPPGRASDVEGGARVPAAAAGPAAAEPSPWPALVVQLQQDAAGLPGLQAGLIEEGGASGLSGLDLRFSRELIFEPGRSLIRPEAREWLNRLVDPLLAQPRWLVVVEAPGDLPPGREPWRARDRADAVRDYLVNQGVAASRFLPPASTEGPEVVVRITGRRSMR
ncbi:OmpA family protein [Sphaerotilus hippei]|uniref:OmpA family protein n=1 Tax=Sphaerotilus hippei TaxID=744406 RepID=UPI0011B3EC47|nr:OmpA family protein [Sphaerotilus hippei]